MNIIFVVIVSLIIFITSWINAGSVDLQVIITGQCGDGVIQSDESCDGSNLNGKTCSTQGFSGGTLSCNSNCTFNTCFKCYPCQFS